MKPPYRRIRVPSSCIFQFDVALIRFLVFSGLLLSRFGDQNVEEVDCHYLSDKGTWKYEGHRFFGLKHAALYRQLMCARSILFFDELPVQLCGADSAQPHKKRSKSEEKQTRAKRKSREFSRPAQPHESHEI